ncbi:hypothetical protein [Phocaeicola sartorii]|uniref:hypothetical protein n=1 Tax=Phocaeicola sartorii TaxID=671267 RepID=UPI003516FD5A
MSEYKTESEIIEILKSLDLSSYPIKDVEKYIVAFSQIMPIVITILPPGKIIIRGRNYNNKENFTLPCSHSYPHKNLVTKCQRANLPGSNMFYGAVNTVSSSQDDPCARIGIITEIGKSIRDNAAKETIVFSSWVVVRELKLVTIFQAHHYSRPNNCLMEIENSFENLFGKKDGYYFADYIASEFSKPVKDGEDFNYLISAVFSNLVCQQHHYDGIYYPGVQIGGAVMNVAIKPDSVNRCLKLVGAGEFNFVREGMNIKEESHRMITLA